MANRQGNLPLDLFIDGHVVFRSMTIPDGSIFDAAVNGSAAIGSEKLEHQHTHTYGQPTGTAVVAANTPFHIVNGATGELQGFKAVVTGAIATGGDRTVTIDLKKSTGGGAFASVLSGAIVLTSADVLLTYVDTGFSAAAIQVGDVLAITVAVAGAAGAQAQGIAVNLFWKEDAAS